MNQTILTASSLSLLLCLSSPLIAQEAAPASLSPKDRQRVVKLVELSGTYADLAEAGFDISSMLLGGGVSEVKPFYELIDQLDRLDDDQDSQEVLFDLSQAVGLNLAQMAELERCLGRLHKAGVKSYAYIENAAGPQYAIASQCDEIVMADMGTIDLGSLAMSTMYMKDALDMLGVDVDVLRCGSFKGAAEPFMLSRMSAHLRGHYLEMLKYMNADVVRRIAKGRDLESGVVRQLQAERLLPAKRALAAGMVDRLVPWKGARASLAAVLGDDDFELKSALKKKKKRSLNLMSLMSNLLNPKDEEEVEEKTLAVLHLSGPIVDGAKPVPGNIVSGPAVDTIRGIANNENVHGVVVRINSPGGSATASEAIVLALADLAEAKPVVCSMGSVAGSGGYYVTCFGRPIFAEAGTITGSIGVLGVKPNLGPLMKRFGVHMELIALDESAGMNAIDRGWTDDDKTRMQDFMDDVYGRFLAHVAKSRGLSVEEVEAMAGGRVWSGEQAVANKLIDAIGGLNEALAMVAEEAAVGDDYEVVHMPRARSFMDSVVEQMAQMRMLVEQPVALSLLQRLGSAKVPLAILWDAVTSARPARVWAVMPAELTIR